MSSVLTRHNDPSEAVFVQVLPQKHCHPLPLFACSFVHGAWQHGGKGWGKGRGGGPDKGGRSRVPGTWHFLSNHRKMLQHMKEKGVLELQQAVPVQEEACAAYRATSPSATSRLMVARLDSRGWAQGRKANVQRFGEQCTKKASIYLTAGVTIPLTEEEKAWGREMERTVERKAAPAGKCWVPNASSSASDSALPPPPPPKSAPPCSGPPVLASGSGVPPAIAESFVASAAAERKTVLLLFLLLRQSPSLLGKRRRPSVPLRVRVIRRQFSVNSGACLGGAARVQPLRLEAY